ncbi:uncharacterized protein LOC111944117 [Cyanistes caeruleus]|uniref:uncharacterized protein LOC111944117 n=1 Tax=Cyanistes caeruleus TaxID=156563 RepID=UPI000CDB763C|nr:uncharacterized protein LOC111944117 [Cyanistes caeruleus]
MLLASALFPPIRKTSQSSNRREMCRVEKESGKNGTNYDDDTREREEMRSKGKGRKASLLYPTEGDKKKESLGLPLIPPIRRAVSPDVGSAAGSLQSSLQLDVQESQEMRPRSTRRSEDDNSEEGGLTRFIFSKSFRRSPSMLLPSTLFPPSWKTSQSSNRREMCSVEKESGKNGSGYDEDTREREELKSKGKRCKVRRPSYVLCGRFSVDVLPAELGELSL